MLFHALAPVYVARSDQQAYEIALHRLRAAAHADRMFPAMATMFAGTGVPGDLSVRDYYMAETVLWHVDHADPGTRIVLACHNTTSREPRSSSTASSPTCRWGNTSLARAATATPQSDSQPRTITSRRCN